MYCIVLVYVKYYFDTSITNTILTQNKKPYKIKSKLLHKVQSASQCSYIAQINKLVTTTMATTMNEGDHSFNLSTHLSFLLLIISGSMSMGNFINPYFSSL